MRISVPVFLYPNHTHIYIHIIKYIVYPFLNTRCTNLKPFTNQHMYTYVFTRLYPCHFTSNKLPCVQIGGLKASFNSCGATKLGLLSNGSFPGDSHKCGWAIPSINLPIFWLLWVRKMLKNLVNPEIDQQLVFSMASIPTGPFVPWMVVSTT